MKETLLTFIYGFFLLWLLAIPAGIIALIARFYSEDAARIVAGTFVILAVAYILGNVFRVLMVIIARGR